MYFYELEIHPKMTIESGIDSQLISESFRILSELHQINESMSKQTYRRSTRTIQPSQFSQGQSFEVNSKSKKQSIQKIQQEFGEVQVYFQQLHHQFVDYHKNIITLTYLFIKFKYHDLTGKFFIHKGNWQKIKDPKAYLNTQKNIYLKVFHLQDFLKKTKSIFADLIQIYPVKNYFLTNPEQQFTTLLIQIGKLKAQIQLDYATRIKSDTVRAVRQLRNLIDITSVQHIKRPILLGFWLITLILMISAIIFLIVFFKINFVTSKDFEKTFPIWRGLWYFILMIWLFGGNTYIFNYYKINFNLMTTLNNFHLPNSTTLFVCAAAFTSIHLFFFMVYLIKLAQINNMHWLNVQKQYYPGICWILFIIFFFTPFRIWNYRSRLYPIIMFWRSLLSPIFGVEFKFAWFTDIFVSLRQPMRDVIYTITYYFIDSKVDYTQTIIYETIIGLVLYSLRIIQNLKFMYQSGLILQMQARSSIKSFLNSITMITSYLCRSHQNSQNYNLYLYIWIFTALTSTLFAYYTDLRYDWNLLDRRYGYLRQKLIVGKTKLYYFVIFINLLLRLAWVMNISPDVLREFDIKPYIAVLFLSSIQILRRAIWTIFRVQRQHIVIQSQLNSLFQIQNHTESQLISMESEKGFIKNPNWLKIQINPDDLLENSKLPMLKQKNNQKINIIKQKLKKIEILISKINSLLDRDED